MVTFNKPFRLLTLLALAIFSVAATPLFSQEWRVDGSHSSIRFEIKHFFTPVSGTFDSFGSTIVFDPENLGESNISATIIAASINTKNDRRDGDLRSPVFFDVENHPTITFESAQIEQTGENTYMAYGVLSIKEVSTDFELPFTLLGMADHPRREGVTVAGISSTFTINRTDFAIGTGNWLSDAVLSHDASLTINLELHSVN
jgi:polyisoprenoid-binding protein YceI